MPIDDVALQMVTTLTLPSSDLVIELIQVYAGLMY